MRHNANRTNKIRSDKIQENGRAELPTVKMRSDRGQKRKPAQKSTKGKNAGEKSGQEPSLKLKDVSTGLYKLIEIGRSQNKQKNQENQRKIVSEAEMTNTRYLYVAFYTPGMDKTRQDKTRQELYLYQTEKKTLTKDNATYVRYKRLIAKKLIQLGSIIDLLRIFKRFIHGGTSRKQGKKK